MNQRIAPASPELRDFYSERHNWRNAGEERMRFRSATRLARVAAGSAVLDVGSRNGDLRKYLAADVRYQGVDIAPEFAGPNILIHDISSGIPFEDASFDYVFMIEVMEHVPTPYQTFGEVRRVLRPGGVFLPSVPNPYHFKELIWNILRIPDRQGHIYSWTRQTMTRLGEMNGFRLDGVAGTYLYPPVPSPFPLLSRSIVYRFVKS
ncbi:MAG TPA: class I SAM-dependent methyltransferase [Gemmatimonadales bacterium]